MSINIIKSNSNKDLDTHTDLNINLEMKDHLALSYENVLCRIIKYLGSIHSRDIIGQPLAGPY